MFCHEALADVASRRAALEANGTQLAFVHLSDDETATAALFRRYGLEDAARVSDPAARLYEAFGLQRAGARQVLNFAVLRRSLQAWRAGHRQTRAHEDVLRLPGVFLVHQGRVLRAHKHATVADRPDYAALVQRPTGF